MRTLAWGAPLLASILLTAPGFADRLITKDGEVVEVLKARQLSDGSYELLFKSGRIVCSASHLKEVEIEGDMSDYVPQNEDEKQKLEKGFVRFEGKWLSKQRYQNLLKQRAEERRERLESLSHHADFSNAYEEETKHFIVRTNATPELLEYYCELLEAYYRLMDKQVGIKPTPTLRRTKMVVNIYRTRDNWEDENEAGVGGGVVGYFSSRDQTLNFYYDSEDPAFTDWVALHECTHLLTYLVEPQAHARIWINEGVADYFGSSDIVRHKGKLKILPGKLQVDRILTVQQAIKEDKYTRLEQLFKIDRGTFNAFHYAHAWSFVYFLNNNKKYEKGFKKFFKLNYTLKKVDFEWDRSGTVKVVPAREVRRILLDSLKVKDVAKLEREWISFIQGIDVSAPEALFKRAYLNFRSGKTEEWSQALKDLNEAIEGGVDHPRAFATRAALHVMAKGGKGRNAAIKDYRKAVELAPLNASFRMSLGLALTGLPVLAPGVRVTFVGQDGDSVLPKASQEKRLEGMMQMGLACDLEPHNTVYSELLESYKEGLRSGAGEGQ